MAEPSPTITTTTTRTVGPTNQPVTAAEKAAISAWGRRGSNSLKEAIRVDHAMLKAFPRHGTYGDYLVCQPDQLKIERIDADTSLIRPTIIAKPWIAGVQQLETALTHCLAGVGIYDENHFTRDEKEARHNCLTALKYFAEVRKLLRND